MTKATERIERHGTRRQTRKIMVETKGKSRSRGRRGRLSEGGIHIDEEASEESWYGCAVPNMSVVALPVCK